MSTIFHLKKKQQKENTDPLGCPHRESREAANS